jgi:large conductance mechanosensitive channel
MSGFKKFLLRGNVVDLAVAVVIGAAFGAVVTALVKDIITPIISAFGGLPNFSAWSFTVNGSKFMIGDFINALLAFLVLAAVVYFMVVLPVQRLMDMSKPQREPEPETRECPKCLSKIPKAASRCAFCTSDLDVFEHEGEHEMAPPPRAIQPAR